jgi:hypothetical protein
MALKVKIIYTIFFGSIHIYKMKQTILLDTHAGDLIAFDYKELYTQRNLDEKETEWISTESKELLQNIMETVQQLVTRNNDLRTRSICLQKVELTVEDPEAEQWQLTVVIEPNLKAEKPKPILGATSAEIVVQETPDVISIGVPFVKEMCKASATLPFHPLFGLTQYFKDQLPSTSESN